MEDLGIMDYLSILKRRKKIFAVTAASVFVLSLVFAMQWDNYRSVARVEVSQPEVALTPDGTNAVSREAMADQRISYLQQKVLATGSLAEIIAKYNLYPQKRQTKPIADIADAMEKKIKIKLLGSSLANPMSAQKATAGQLSAIAFDLSFDYDDPQIVQKVTNELVSRFLDEDMKQRRTQAAETSSFLASQLKVLEESLAEQEKKIADFRSTYKESRPEALAFNQQAATTVMLNLQNIESQITTNIGAQGALRGQLAGVDPYARVLGEGQILTTPTTQLRALKSEYANLTTKYGPQHPDVVKAGRQIEGLEKQVGVSGQTASLRALIADTQTKLAAAKEAYGAENPDVIALQTKLGKLQDQLQVEATKPVRGSGVKDADNPVYLQIVSQLQATEEQGRALVAQRDALREQLEKHQKAIAENPMLEQQMASLSRDYDNAQLRYRELKAKKMEADMSQTIEQDRSGQRLQIINPPELPTKTQPGRLVFILVGLFAAVVGGGATVFGVQVLSQSVVGPRHLQALTGVAPMIVVPYLVTKREKKTITVQQKKMAVYGAVGFVVLVIVFSYAVMPLDVLMSVLARKMGLS